MDMPTVRWQEFTSTATMEPADILLELPEFDNYAEIAGNPDITISDPIFNHTETFVNQGPTDVPSYSFRLTGEPGKIIGLSKSLKVQAGDKISASVFGKYLMPDGSEDPTDIAASLADAFLTTFGITSTQEVATINQFFTDLLGGTLTFTKPDDPSGNNVIAGINCLVFDNDFNFVDAGFQLFTAAAVNDHEELALPEYIVPTDGYVFIYTSNESPQVTQVHFDDMVVTHEKLVPDEAYDPDLVAYRYGFNGKEKDQMGEWGGSGAGNEAANANYPILWTNDTGVTITGNSLQKTNPATGWGQHGASSVNELPAGEDGWLEFTLVETGKHRAIGLTETDGDYSLEDIDFGIYVHFAGTIQVIENNVSRGSARRYESGDVVRIERTGNVITYAHNGTVFYTSGISSTSRLIADATFHTYQGTIQDVRASFGTEAQEEAAAKASQGLAHYDYGFRIYNPALGRFLSVDPISREYPWLTPYQFASNTPIQAIDLDGLEAKTINKLSDDFEKNQGYKIVIDKKKHTAVIHKVQLLSIEISGGGISHTVRGNFRETEISISKFGKIESIREFNFDITGSKLLPGHMGADLGFITKSAKSTLKRISRSEHVMPSNSNFIDDPINQVIGDELVGAIQSVMRNSIRLHEEDFSLKDLSRKDRFEMGMEVIIKTIMQYNNVEDPFEFLDKMIESTDGEQIELNIDLEDSKKVASELPGVDEDLDD